MQEKLPPLFTLQAFEVASRLGSFSRAADELNLTPGAVSRQVRLLEDWSGQMLFERKGPKVMLTNEGHALRTRLERPLSALHEAIYPPANQGVEVLQIAILASTAKEWLIPRLADFIARHPEIRLTIQTDYALKRPAPRVAMVAIRRASLLHGDVACETLFEDRLVAVGAPALMAALGREQINWSPRMMMQHTTTDWQSWAAAAGLPPAFVPQGIAFNDADVLLEAAACGLGIAVTRLSIAWRRLQEGSLVLACDVLCASSRDHLLAVREDCADMHAVRVFLSWVRGQASQWSQVQAEFEQHLRHAGRLP